MPNDDDRLEVDVDAGTAELQAELEANLAAGLVPNGWEHRVQWHDENDGVRRRTLPALALVASAAAACGLAWGWVAGFAALFFGGGLAVLLPGSKGPRVGQLVTHSYTPPAEVVFEAGVAGHKVVDVTRGRPTFTATRPATKQDVRKSRRVGGIVAMGFTVMGALVLLEESGAISPAVFVRASALVAAAGALALAVLTWRTYSKVIPLVRDAEAAPALEREDGVVDRVLDTATSGASVTDTVAESVLALLPLRVLRLVVPFIIVAFGALIVLVAFSVVPDRSDLWSGLTSAMELLAFTFAGVRAVLLVGLAVVRRKWSALKAALEMVAFMALLLLAAKLFGWLDGWAAVIHWVADRVG